MNGSYDHPAAQRPALRRATIFKRLCLGLLVGTTPLVGVETALASRSVFTLNDGETVERVVLRSGEAPLGSCFSPDQLLLRPVASKAGGVGTVWDVGDSELLALRTGPASEVRYGIPLHNGMVETLPEDGTDDLPPAAGGSLSVVDARSGLPLRGAALLLRAADGRLCRLGSDEHGIAVLPDEVSSAGMVVAADGFVGGLVPVPATGPVRLPRARSIAVHVSSPTGSEVADLAVLAFPEWRARRLTGSPLGVVAADGVGAVQLPGIPVSRSRVLVAAFRGGVPVGMSALDADAGDEVSLHFRSGAVTAELPAQDGSPPVDTVRIERLRDGTELADFSFGPFPRSLDFRLRPTGPLLSRDGLPARAWYSVTGAEDNPSFYLDAGEQKSLGDLTAPNLLTLVVSGPESTQGWVTYSCRDDSRDSEWQWGRSLISAAERSPLWLPQNCVRVLGRVFVDGWLNQRFRWSDGDPRRFEVVMRRGLAFRGSVVLRGEGPVSGATVTVHDRRSIGDWGGYSLDTSGPAGEFEVRVPVEGDYVVEATLDGYYAPNVAASTGQTAVEIEMSKAARLQGVVRNSRLEPVEGRVSWRYAGTRSAESVQTRGQSTSTNAAGAFSFAALPPGRTEITVSVLGADPELVEYDLVPGNNDVEIRLENPLVRIEGVVVGPPDTVADADRVIAVPDPAYTRPPSWLRAELAADGTFFFENMSPGTVELAATTRSHASRPVELVIAPTDTVRHVRLELLEASGRISGRIESTASLAGARVGATAGIYHSTSADLSASGEFELSDLAVGAWSLSLHHAGLSQGQVFYSDLATVEIQREGSSRFIVVDLTALPVLTLSGGPPGETVYAPGNGNVKLDQNGNGILRLPRAGAHELFWKVEDHYFYQDVTVEEDTHLDLTEPPARREPVPLFDY